MNDISIDIINAVKEIKSAIVRAQARVSANANAEMLSLYFGIGRYVSYKTQTEKWGTGIIDTISAQLQKEMPGLRGFSGKSIRKMRQFYEAWSDSAIWPSATAKLESGGNTREFAVQHIGLYAQALTKSAEAMSLRDTLFDAAGETRTIVAAAAFRALSDMSAFDAQIDTRRLDSTLAACAGDAVAASAARSMAVQLCGERRVNSARPALERILASPDSPEILRRGASRALARLR